MDALLDILSITQSLDLSVNISLDYGEGQGITTQNH